MAIDLCKANYQTLLITYVELTIRNAIRNASNQNEILLGLKIID